MKMITINTDIRILCKKRLKKRTARKGDKRKRGREKKTWERKKKREREIMMQVSK